MATSVTVVSAKEGLYTVKIKHEFESNTVTREFTKESLNEYVEGLEQYCEQKGYQFIFEDNGLLDRRGGKREGAGRPAIGTSKKITITLPDEMWEAIERNKGDESMAAYFRQAIMERNLTYRDILAIYDALEYAEEARVRNLEYVEQQLKDGAAPYEVPDTDEDHEELYAVQMVKQKIEQNYAELLTEYGYIK